MVIVAVSRRIVFAADVDDGVAFGEAGRVARADERRGRVGGEEAEDVYG